MLEINRNNPREEAAWQKILRCHCLNDGINIETFVGMDLNILPLVIVWIVRDGAELSVLYLLLQSLPSLFEYNAKVDAKGLKRKRTNGLE